MKREYRETTCSSKPRELYVFAPTKKIRLRTKDEMGMGMGTQVPNNHRRWTQKLLDSVCCFVFPIRNSPILLLVTEDMIL